VAWHSVRAQTPATRGMDRTYAYTTEVGGTTKTPPLSQGRLPSKVKRDS
jgi:hypothetical protein